MGYNFLVWYGADPLPLPLPFKIVGVGAPKIDYCRAPKIPPKQIIA